MYAAKDRGNARQAIDLLRVGGEVARRSDDIRVDDSHIVTAQELVQRGRLRNRIEDQTQHAQLLLETVAYIEQAREVSGTVESDQGSIRIGRRIACRGSTDDSQKHPEPSLRSPHARVSAAMGSKSRRGRRSVLRVPARSRSGDSHRDPKGGRDETRSVNVTQTDETYSPRS